MTSMRLAGTLLTLMVLAGCGAAMPMREAATPSAPPPREPMTIEEATEQIRVAERTLGGASATEQRPTGGASASGPASAPAAAAPPAKAAPTDRAEKDEKTDALQKNAERTDRSKETGAEEPSPCERACRALRSMSSAVNALCRMTGPADARCAQAKATLEKSRESASLRTCGCAP